jgi:hypothetical protein
MAAQGIRRANDLGQWLFALYVAASVVATTRAGTHLELMPSHVTIVP